MLAIQDSPKLESRVPNPPFEGLDLDDRARSRHGACTPFILEVWAVQKWSNPWGLQKRMSIQISKVEHESDTIRKNYSTLLAIPRDSRHATRDVYTVLVEVC
jgi:hypothetical protein